MASPRRLINAWPAIGRLIVLAASVFALSSPAMAQDPEIVVEAPSYRAEIERILAADNVNIRNMSPRQVAATMTIIPRGRAPDDFWTSYQAHLRAWQQLSVIVGSTHADEIGRLAAERAVNSSFDDVERIALRYGARMPQTSSRSEAAR